MAGLDAKTHENTVVRQTGAIFGGTLPLTTIEDQLVVVVRNFR